jgi:hypothetical protein
MLSVFVIAAVLVAATAAIHAAGLGFVLSQLVKTHREPPTRTWPITWTLIRVAWFLMIIHCAEITIWALFFMWERCLPDAETAFYFSGVTYATIGYGDVVLAKPWRMLAPIEGAVGILMFALSSGLFFAAVARIYSPRLRDK